VDAGGQVALVVPGERARDVDGLVAVPAEERPVLHAKDERRFLLADVAAREPGGERLEREALVLAGELVGGVDLDVAARAQRGLVGAAHHRGSRALARVALDLHGCRPTSQLAILSHNTQPTTRGRQRTKKKIRPLTAVEDEGEKRPAGKGEGRSSGRASGAYKPLGRARNSSNQ